MASRETAFVEITPEVLLKAYACGIFPMAENADDPALFWIDPEERGIIPLETFHVPRRLARTVRSDQFIVTTDSAFADVIAACAELRVLARDELAEAERRLKSSAPEILPAFIPLGPLRLDLDRLERNAARPFEATTEVSPLRRQWAIWRWARGR